MPKELKVAYALLAVVAFHDTFSHVGFQGVANRLIEENKRLKEEVNYNAKVARYLAEIINKNDIPLDDFDIFAINHM